MNKSLKKLRQRTKFFGYLFRPWLQRVGASVHPGGGIPAVLGGVLISLRKLKSQK